MVEEREPLSKIRKAPSIPPPDVAQHIPDEGEDLEPSISHCDSLNAATSTKCRPVLAEFPVIVTRR